MNSASFPGLTVRGVTPQRTVFALTVSENGLTMHGTAHDGLLFSPAEEAFAIISSVG